MNSFRSHKAVAAVVTVAALGASAAGVRAELAERNVLVVYDSRIADSVLVAEHYAGSAKVPGGVGSVAGARPGVLTLDLQAAGAPHSAGADISMAAFVTHIRDPIRAHLTSQGLGRQVRCLVLTKGITHRIVDTDASNAGDNPGVAVNEINAGDYNAASVDAELCLLWQSLEVGEAGGTGDSKADGCTTSPTWGKVLPVRAWTTRYIASTKSFAQQLSPAGILTSALPPTFQTTAASAGQLTPGDVYLVCRLDGNTVQDVRGMIDRAHSVMYDVDTAAVILDEGASDGVANGAANSELDNQGLGTHLRAGDDYEQSRDRLLADGRLDPANVRYNAAGGAANFIVGNNSYGLGIVVSSPVILLASEGSNHSGGEPAGASTTFAESFTYPPGAIFNTIESWNGRKLHGLGDNGQEQNADFIGAGGTFGIGNVNEPFAFSLADNTFLVQNFVLGNLQWAEAAYSAIPQMSWMQVVLGDPLARARRTSDDINGDQQVNVDDLYAWQENPVDINRDSAVNATDYALVEAAVRRAEAVGMKGEQR